MSIKFLAPLDGQRIDYVKVVSRNPDNVEWFKSLAKDMGVSQGAVFDTMADIARERRQFKHLVKRKWHDRYSI